MTAYYNEFDPEAAGWLEELIRQGHIAPGHVDTRSIEDVRPDDLRGYTQCHFFAGIGVWSYALRRAGWADDRPIWTGSCPCQPFSAAGKGAAFTDERHLWPAFHHLIKVRKPPGVLGEQVASAAVDDWIDLVHADMEALDYAFGSIPFPSAGVGAPHIRDRNYWAGIGMGYTSGKGLAQRQRQRRILGDAPGADQGKASIGAGVRDVSGLADSDGSGRESRQQGRTTLGYGAAIESNSGAGGLADAYSKSARWHSGSAYPAQNEINESEPSDDYRSAHDGGISRPGSTNGYWRDADWLGCRDGKWRPVEPGTFPLVDGAPARVVRLRGYGNVINAIAAQAWIETVMECI